MTINHGTHVPGVAEMTALDIQLLAWRGIRRWPLMRAEALFRLEANIRESWALRDSGLVG